MDLMFPHHECEIAQNVASRGTSGVHYWMHNNMITINGRKMGKSLGNFITLFDLFSGNNSVLSQAYSPMTIRFFILQAHYRSTLDFSNEALQAAEKGFAKVMAAYRELDAMAGSAKAEGEPSETLKKLNEDVYAALCDDLNTPVALSVIFEAVKLINGAKAGQTRLSGADVVALKTLFDDVLVDVLGLKAEGASDNRSTAVIDGLMKMVLAERAEAKAAKDWAKSDRIRNALTELGVNVKDTKDGVEWSL